MPFAIPADTVCTYFQPQEITCQGLDLIIFVMRANVRLDVVQYLEMDAPAKQESRTFHAVATHYFYLVHVCFHFGITIFIYVYTTPFGCFWMCLRPDGEKLRLFWTCKA